MFSEINSTLLIKSNSHAIADNPERVRLTVLPHKTFKISPTIPIYLEHWMVSVKEVGNDLLIMNPQAFIQNLQSNINLSILSKVCEGSNHYYIKAIDGNSIPLSDIFDSRDSIMISDMLDRISDTDNSNDKHESDTKARSIVKQPSSEFSLRISGDSVEYSTAKDRRVFSQFKEPTHFFCCVDEDSESMILDEMILKYVLCGKHDRIDSLIDDKVKFFRDSVELRTTKGNSLMVQASLGGGGLKNRFELLEDYNQKSKAEVTDSQRMGCFAEAILARADEKFSVFCEQWKALSQEYLSHPDLFKVIQDKLDSLAREGTVTLRWWICIVADSIIQGLESIRGPNTPARTQIYANQILSKIKIQIKSASQILNLSNFPIKGLDAYVSIVEDCPCYKYMLFDGSSITALINQALDMPDVMRHARKSMMAKLNVESQLKKRKPVKNESSEDNRRSAALLFKVKDVITTGLKNFVHVDSKVFNLKDGQEAGKVSHASAFTFEYKGYYVGFESKKLSWNKQSLDSLMSTTELLGKSQWSKPYKVKSRIFYLSNDQVLDPETGESKTSIGLVVIDLKPLTEGNAPQLTRLCQVMKDFHPTSCDLVASETQIVMHIAGFMNDKYIAVYPNTDIVADCLDPVIIKIEDVASLRSLYPFLTETKASRNYLTIKSMQYYSKRLFMVVDHSEKLKLICMRWNYNISNFETISSIDMTRLAAADRYHEFSGIAWLEKKDVPYIVHIESTHAMSAYTMHQRRIIRVNKKLVISNIPEEITTTATLSRQVDYAKKPYVTIAAVTGNLSTPDKIVNTYRLSIRSRQPI